MPSTIHYQLYPVFFIWPSWPRGLRSWRIWRFLRELSPLPLPRPPGAAATSAFSFFTTFIFKTFILGRPKTELSWLKEPLSIKYFILSTRFKTDLCFLPFKDKANEG